MTKNEMKHFLYGKISNGLLGYPVGEEGIKPNYKYKPQDNIFVNPPSAAILSDDLTQNKTYYASSYVSLNTPNKSFDNNTSTYWQSSTVSENEYIAVDFGSSVIIKIIFIQCMSNYILRYIAVEGSADNLSWTTVYELELIYSSMLQQFYLRGNADSFRYWRIRNNGQVFAGTSIRIATINMYTTTGVL